ncbi:MAG: hypothetical protein AB1578_20065 [Thermodesulfobacteriota bacterium]
MSEPTWVVFCDGRDGDPFGFRCKRCGEVEDLGPKPVSVRQFARRGKAFFQDHADCEEPAA